MSTTKSADGPSTESVDEAAARTVYQAVRGLAGPSGGRLSLPDLEVATRMDPGEIETVMGYLEQQDPVAFQRVGSQPVAWEISL